MEIRHFLREFGVFTEVCNHRNQTASFILHLPTESWSTFTLLSNAFSAERIFYLFTKKKSNAVSRIKGSWRPKESLLLGTAIFECNYSIFFFKNACFPASSISSKKTGIVSPLGIAPAPSTTLAHNRCSNIFWLNEYPNE